MFFSSDILDVHIFITKYSGVHEGFVKIIKKAKQKEKKENRWQEKSWKLKLKVDLKYENVYIGTL